MKRRNRLLAQCLIFALLLGCLPVVSAADPEPEIKQQICADYYDQKFSSSPEITLEDVHIEKYYGCYNGVHVVLMDVEELAYPSSILNLYVAGLLFRFPCLCASMFLAYHDGVFTPVSDAYEQGLLTKSNLISITQIHYEGHIYPPFSDVRKGDWHEEAVRYVFLNGLFQGIGWDRFAPEDTMTRSMLVTVLWRSQGEPLAYSTEFFTDMEEGSWYADAVDWAFREGIAFGTGNRKFSSNDPVSWESFATMLYRLSGADVAPQKKDPPQEYRDLADVSAWAKNAVVWAIEEGILLGSPKEDGHYLKPGNAISRAEAAAMLMRFMEDTSPEMRAVDLAVYTTMPKFSAEFISPLPDALKEMGIQDVFSPKAADFSGIAEDLYISSVTHKAVIELGESGVSAGAATIVDIAPSAPVIEKTAAVVADRPYLYLIIDADTRLPLFMGTTMSVA